MTMPIGNNEYQRFLMPYLTCSYPKLFSHQRQLALHCDT